jgi:EAL domain-containing protein (putative c-di-GMP-specific phosphodiesterase class I)/CheY-like chemotaxis protein
VQDGNIMVERPAPRILVLDDDPFMVKLITRTLANLGVSHVVGCTSGIAALEHVGRPSNGPDIIMCDLNMPEMDGLELLRRLVDHNYTGSVILVSGESERVLQAAEQLARAHSLKLLGHLGKPVMAEALAELLEQWSPASLSEPPENKKTYSASAVRSAIKNGELVNYYQPKVALATGQVVGVETLVRWFHPEDGMVFPNRFIGIAEENGLIDDLTRVVLTGALAHAKTWQDAGIMLKIAVNISMENLASLDFANFAVEQMLAAGIAPQDVTLEITESRLPKDLRNPLEVLTRLRLKRVRLSIDDFGTGHSSLSQLRDMPFDELKIDRTFVHNAWSNDTLRAICEASHRVAQQLGMEVVAEGVENQEDLNFLCRLRCDFVQGYFIAKPMPAAALPEWIKMWQSHARKLEPLA